MKDSTSITDEKMLRVYKTIGDKAVGTISMAELCINNKHFNIEHLVKIADVLEVDLTDFFHGINLK